MLSNGAGQSTSTAYVANPHSVSPTVYVAVSP